MTLIWLLCYFRRIKPSQQKHSGVVVWVCCRCHPESFLCLFSVCGAARRGSAGLELILLAGDQLIVRSSHTPLQALSLLFDTFFSSPPSLLWKTSLILCTFAFLTSHVARTLGNIIISQVFHLQSWESLLDCRFVFPKNSGVSSIQTEVINVVSAVKKYFKFPLNALETPATPARWSPVSSDWRVSASGQN